MIKEYKDTFKGRLAVMDEVLSPYDRNIANIETNDSWFCALWQTESGGQYLTAPNVTRSKQLSHYDPDYIYKGKTFRYNRTDALVSMMSKASEKELQEEEEWKKAHNGNSLMGYTSDGYYVWETVGLMKDNWDNETIRNEYLDEWLNEHELMCSELEEEFGAEYKIKIF